MTVGRHENLSRFGQLQQKRSEFASIVDDQVVVMTGRKVVVQVACSTATSRVESSALNRRRERMRGKLTVGGYDPALLVLPQTNLIHDRSRQQFVVAAGRDAHLRMSARSEIGHDLH